MLLPGVTPFNTASQAYTDSDGKLIGVTQNTGTLREAGREANKAEITCVLATTSN